MRSCDIGELDAQIALAIKCLEAYERECNGYLWAHAAGEPLDMRKLEIVDGQIAAEKQTIERLWRERYGALMADAEALTAEMKAEFRRLKAQPSPRPK